MDSYFSSSADLPLDLIFYDFIDYLMVIFHLIMAYHFVVVSMNVSFICLLEVRFWIVGIHLAYVCLLLFSVPFKY